MDNRYIDSRQPEYKREERHRSRWGLSAMLAGLALAALVSGCMIGPYDEMRVESTTSPIAFWGVHPDPNRWVRVSAYNFRTEEFHRIGNFLSADRPTWTVSDGPLYRWEGTRVLGPDYWENGYGGRYARVKATTDTSGERSVDVITFGEDWPECWRRWPTRVDFALNCVSPNHPEARIYTSDYIPGVSLEPIATGTEHLFDYDQGMWCGLSVQSSGLGSYFLNRLRSEYGAGNQVAGTGFSYWYDNGTRPFNCWERVQHQYWGRVKFDLSEVPPDTEIALASLSYRRIDDGAYCPPFPYGDPDREMLLVGSRSFQPGLQDVASDRFVRGTGTAAGNGGPVDNAVSEWDVTETVQRWLEGEVPNHGLVLEGPPMVRDNRDPECQRLYTDFQLSIRYVQ
jgi:hypothetical protein